MNLADQKAGTKRCFFHPLLSIVLCASLAYAAQTPVGVLGSKSEAKTPAPSLVPPSSIPNPASYSQGVTPQSTYRSGFLKNLTIDSFGYDLSPTAQGFESSGLSPGPFTAHGLECPYCVQKPLMNRSRFTLQPFGSQATLYSWDKRMESFVGFGGVEAWLPDSAPILNRRASSFNDAWLMQTQAGSNVALDPGRHFWLGATGRYLQNFGEGPKHWNTFSGNATFRFGH